MPLLGKRPVHSLYLAVLPEAKGIREVTVTPPRRLLSRERRGPAGQSAVRHYALDADFHAPPEEGERPGHERANHLLALVGQQLRLCDA